MIDLENGVARYLRPWEINKCVSDLPDGKAPFYTHTTARCVTHNIPWLDVNGRRCKEGWRDEKIAEYEELRDTVSNLLGTRDLIKKHLVEAMKEFRVKCMHIPFGIQDAVFNDALREVVYEYTVPHELKIDIGTIKDRLSDLDGEENSDGHTKAEQEKLDKEAQ